VSDRLLDDVAQHCDGQPMSHARHFNITV